MSSLRNAIQRRSHRERAQPTERARLGLLEKHKDYSLRAADHNRKKAQLKSLRRKAAERNEDEFYFGMVSRKGAGTALSRGKAWTGTIDGDRGNRALDVETVRLLKTQDMGYVRTMRNVTAKEVERLRERVVLAGGTGEDEDEEDEARAAAAVKPKKIVFAEDVEKRERIRGGKSQKGGSNVGGNDDDEDEDMDDADDRMEDDDAETEAERKALVLEKLQRRLQLARRKLKALTDAENELEVQRAKMAKTASFTGITKSGKKVKARERKR